MSVAIVQVLKFYSNYVSGTFHYNCLYVGGSFCCNYAVRSLCNITLMQVVSAGKIWVTILLKLYTWGSLLQSCRQYFLQCILHIFISIVIIQVTVSIVAMYVTVLSTNFIFLSLTNRYPFFIKLTRKHQKAKGIMSNLHFTILVNILPKLRYFLGRIYIKVC